MENQNKKKNSTEPMTIKSCYSHIGGKFGQALTIRLEGLGWIVRDSQSKDFVMTPKGEKEFRKLGVDF